MLVDPALGRTHQIGNIPLAHFFKRRLGGDAAIHHPSPARFAVTLFDAIQKGTQRFLLRTVAVHHFVGQRKSIRSDDQRNHNLHTIRPTIAAIATLGFSALFHLAFKIGAGQIIQQHLEIGMKQLGPFLLQPYEHLLFVLHDPVQAPV